MIAAISTVHPHSARTRAALHAVPRHLFVPPVGLACAPDDTERVINRGLDPDDWLQAVYSDTTITTQLDDGATPIGAGEGSATSSASAPSTVAALLDWLAPEPGHRVLDIGTGTGFTAALLTHLTGDAGEVTSVEIDPAVAERAAKNLATAGHEPHLVVGDGALGCPERAPFDRVHVTCGVRRVPYAWVEQTRPGGVIVAPYCPNFGLNHALRLVVTSDGTAYGRFPGFASYMMMRSQRAAPWHSDNGNGHRSTTRVDPRTIRFAPAGADLAIAAVTGLRAVTAQDGDQYRMWVIDQEMPSQWAAVTYRPGEEEYEVYQLGDRPVWEETVDAYFRWVAWGEPGRDRFGMTVRPDGQEIWLDTPDQVIGSEPYSGP